MTDFSHHQPEDNLAKMANDIADFFRAQGHEEAVAGITNHLRNYWTRRMREKLSAHLDDPALGLDPFAREALLHLRDTGNMPAPTAPGGDAG